MADDAITIYAPPNVLRQIRAPTQWLVSPNCLILPGDRLQVLDPRTGSLRGEVSVVGGTIAAVEIGPSVAAAEGGVRVSGLDVQLDAQARPILDQRGVGVQP